ncbi:tRNA lysidine(34) synthetase TilS [Candidatus Omnitrophota bacterium]
MKQDLFVRCKEFIADNRLLQAREKVILAVSGGPDSIFLFNLFLELRQSQKIDLVVAHLNHGLREEAGAEEEFVASLCRDNAVRFVSQSKDVRRLCKGDSLEQTARNLRYDFFLATARRLKIKKVILAHHKDDLIETVLLRILRGTGLLGLRGMLPLSKYKKVVLIRPLLFLEKYEILTFLKNRNLTFMLDKSNLEDVFLRNKIRHDLAPSLARMSPTYKNSIYNLAKTISWDYDYIFQKAHAAFERSLIRQTDTLVEINTAKVLSLHRALAYNLLRICIERAKGSLRRVESKHLEQLFELLHSLPVGSVIDLPGLKVSKKEHSLAFRRMS